MLQKCHYLNDLSSFLEKKSVLKISIYEQNSVQLDIGVFKKEPAKKEIKVSKKNFLWFCFNEL